MSDFLMRLLQRNRGELAALRPTLAHPFAAQEMSANAPYPLDASRPSAPHPAEVDIQEPASAPSRNAATRPPNADAANTLSRPAPFSSPGARVIRQSADLISDEAGRRDVFEPAAPETEFRAQADSSMMAAPDVLAAPFAAGATPTLNATTTGSESGSGSATVTPTFANAEPLETIRVPESTQANRARTKDSLRIETNAAPMPMPQIPASPVRPAGQSEERRDERREERRDEARALPPPHTASRARPASYSYPADAAHAHAKDGSFSSVTVTIGAVEILPASPPVPAPAPVRQSPSPAARGISVNEYLRMREEGGL